MTINISNHCFGPSVTVDRKTVFIDSQDNRYDKEMIEARHGLLSELIKLRDNLDSYDWQTIAEIIVSRGNFDETESSYEDCDQCGNYNYTKIYESY